MGEADSRPVLEKPSLPNITIDVLIRRYDAVLLDAYGVLVHSSGPYPGAVELIQRLNRSKKPYYLLTNDASRSPSSTAARYQGFGLAIDADRIITSGLLLKKYFAEHNLAGAKCAVLGTADSAQYVEGAGGIVVPPADAFDVLVVADASGFPFIETMDAALSSLLKALGERRKVHLLLPNPDLMFPSGVQGFGFGAGSVASMFQAALQARYPSRTDLEFIGLGKPNGAIFTEALHRSGTRDMVMIGDQLETDIKGARAFGLDAVWVNNDPTTESLARLRRVPSRLRPTFRLPSLQA